MMPTAESADNIRTLRKCARWLRHHFPVLARVNIYIRKRNSIKNSQGEICRAYFWTNPRDWYTPKPRSFTLLIEMSSDWEVMQDRLFHEWTHLRRYPGDEHDPLFDLEYGEICRQWNGRQSNG